MLPWLRAVRIYQPYIHQHCLRNLKTLSSRTSRRPALCLFPFITHELHHSQSLNTGVSNSRVVAAVVQSQPPRDASRKGRNRAKDNFLLFTLHHAHLQPAEVDVGTAIQPLENFVGVLLHPILDVHLAPRLVLLLARYRKVVPASDQQQPKGDLDEELSPEARRVVSSTRATVARSKKRGPIVKMSTSLAFYESWGLRGGLSKDVLLRATCGDKMRILPSTNAKRQKPPWSFSREQMDG